MHELQSRTDGAKLGAAGHPPGRRNTPQKDKVNLQKAGVRMSGLCCGQQPLPARVKMGDAYGAGVLQTKWGKAESSRGCQSVREAVHSPC